MKWSTMYTLPEFLVAAAATVLFSVSHAIFTKRVIAILYDIYQIK